MAAPLALLLVVAVTVRAALFRSSLAEFISERVEVVSPLSSWEREITFLGNSQGHTVLRHAAQVTLFMATRMKNHSDFRPVPKVFSEVTENEKYNEEERPTEWCY